MEKTALKLKINMKKIFTILLATILFIGCSSDDTTIVKPVEVEQEATMYVYIIGTNAKQLIATIIRNDVEIPVKAEWITQGKIPVKDGDILIISGNGELVTEGNELYLDVIDEFNIGMHYGNWQVGSELKYHNYIGKETI